ncbi:MAG: divalent-cation tolerance protein CutA [Proteobacteria bacterium]|nr:divalent-cation tolerance protein CutA [Pseudomonadota bacterium]MBU1709667.1 divalent-cation tolerance protein CutA [Pseudomonadota bacterium]
MTRYIQVITTVETRADAEKIADEILGLRLAACVQIVGPVTSKYWWQGKLEQAEEYQCVIKSRQDIYPALESAIKAVHPYDVPEILAVPVLSGNVDYLAWLDAELQRESGKQ